MSFTSELQASITYPLEDKEWLKKTWPLLVIAFIPVVGLFSIILLKGWRFETIKSLKENNGKLPDFNFMVMLKEGAFLWAAMFSYILVPGLICSLLGVGGPIGFILDIFSILQDGVGAWLETEPTDWVITVFVYLCWGVVSYPIYQAGMVRYAISGNWKTLFNIPANFFTLIRNIRSFALFYMYWFIISFLLILIDSSLAFTGIGILITPLSMCLYYSSTAYELSHLIQDIEKRKDEVLRIK